MCEANDSRNLWETKSLTFRFGITIARTKRESFTSYRKKGLNVIYYLFHQTETISINGIPDIREDEKLGFFFSAISGCVCRTKELGYFLPITYNNIKNIDYENTTIYSLRTPVKGRTFIARRRRNWPRVGRLQPIREEHMKKIMQLWLILVWKVRWRLSNEKDHGFLNLNWYIRAYKKLVSGLVNGC